MEENNQNIIEIFEDNTIHEKDKEIKIIIHLISRITFNNNRFYNFIQ